MKTWLGVLMSAMPTYPSLYPGYVLQEQKQKVETLKIDLNTGWILLSICIPVLVLVFLLFWTRGRSHKRNEGESLNRRTCNKGGA
jgi:hypothetical protein